ncbi:drug/metabolite transporter, DME family [Evansella caseinilytica]|uniref:Drug/metabolite transporter, DME family n=1 Tax=Evansella caseinilytica TaxID=1503961 RepID=A0A1H3SZ55_9BACI|nr:EamA family transporter [Evansella caseinilytica]SDZ43204.1 drug/metabolite transporter, DME family [Evansella caseinilytica]
MQAERKYVFFVLFAAILWGTTGTAQTFAPESADPVAIGAVRSAVGGLALLIYVAFRGKLYLRGWSLLHVTVAAVGMAAYQPLFFSAVSVTGVAVGTVIAIGSAPILAGLLEWVIKGNVPERKWWFATILAIAGCLLLFSNEQELSLSLAGILMALGAGLSFAIYAIMSKRLLERHSFEAVAAVVFSLSALCLMPVLFVYDLSWLLEPNGIAIACHLGLITTAVAYLLFSQGLTGVPAATGVSLSLAEPLTAAMLGVLVVGEMLTPAAWLGAGLLFAGLRLLSFSRGMQHQDERTSFLKRLCQKRKLF